MWPWYNKIRAQDSSIRYRISAFIKVALIEAPGASSGGELSQTGSSEKSKNVPLQNTRLTHLEVKVKGGNSGKFASFHQIFPNFLHKYGICLGMKYGICLGFREYISTFVTLLDRGSSSNDSHSIMQG